MKIHLIFFIVIFMLLGCKETNEDLSGILTYPYKNSELNDYRSVDLGYYKLKIPKSWKKTNAVGIDSFGIQFETSEGELIDSDFGQYSFNLESSDQKSKTKVAYYQLNNRKIKVVTPIISGNGITGVYIENVYKNRKRKTHLNLYGINLSEKSEKELLNVIGTIDFRK